jgi:hypothetical protein
LIDGSRVGAREKLASSAVVSEGASGHPEIAEHEGGAGDLANASRGNVSAAINFYEQVLYLRQTKALSEYEFHTLWAGNSDEVLRLLAVHYCCHDRRDEALTSRARSIRRFWDEHCPLLSIQIARLKPRSAR